MTAAEQQEVIRLHGMWRRGEAGGVRADLRCANLYRADLYGADLRCANLYGANLRCANLYGANLRGAKRGGVTVQTLLLAGEVAKYWALIYGTTDGAVFMEYGCETEPRTAEQWREELPAICAQHVPGRDRTYERVLRGLLAIDWRMVEGEVAP